MEALSTGVDDVNLMEGHKVHHLLAYLRLPAPSGHCTDLVWVPWCRRIGSMRKSGPVRNLSGSLANGDYIPCLDIVLDQRLGHLGTQMIDGLEGQFIHL